MTVRVGIWIYHTLRNVFRILETIYVYGFGGMEEGIKASGRYGNMFLDYEMWLFWKLYTVVLRFGVVLG